MSNTLFLTISILFLFLGSCIFFIGIHNIDNCQNIKRMEDRMNLELCRNNIDKEFTYVETNLKEDMIELDECHRKGIMLNITGLLIIIYIAIINISNGINRIQKTK